MDLLELTLEHQVVEWLVSGYFGLEKEGLRATPPAQLAGTLHPESLGDRETNPYIKTDFGEAQPEIVTPPLTPYTKAHHWLQALQLFLVQSLPADEYMWPFSVPCQLPVNEADILTSATTDRDLIEYRKYTTAKYGKKRQLVSGIHINYSFHPLFLEKVFLAQNELATMEELQNDLYLKLANHFLRYQWLLVYLFGATPIAADEFFEGPFYEGVERPEKPMRSLRNSLYGFTNNQEVIVRHDTVEHYARDLQRYVAEGALAKEREYYGAVRLRGFIKDSVSLLNHGIQYLEFRSFDLNPYHEMGLAKDTLQFIHLFFLTLLLLDKEITVNEAEEGNRITKEVASEHPLSQTKRLDEGLWLLEQMKKMYDALHLDESYLNLIEQAADHLQHPEKTLSGQILSDLNRGVSLFELGDRLGNKHKQAILTADTLRGFEYLNSPEQEHLLDAFELENRLKEREDSQ